MKRYKKKRYSDCTVVYDTRTNKIICRFPTEKEADEFLDDPDIQNWIEK